MRQDWIEFKKNKTDCLSLRPEYIIGISEFPFNTEENLSEYTRILFDAGDTVQDIAIAEPYEQVKQKIIDAENVDLSDVVVEHFTRDEYEKIAAVMKAELKGCIEDGADIERTTKIVDKLNEILKEDK